MVQRKKIYQTLIVAHNNGGVDLLIRFSDKKISRLILLRLGNFCMYVCQLTLYWKRKIPQKRLKRSAVSRERLTEVALLSFTTMGIQLYRAYIHSA